jgi:hypothetical protein
MILVESGPRGASAVSLGRFSYRSSQLQRADDWGKYNTIFSYESEKII